MEAPSGWPTMMWMIGVKKGGVLTTDIHIPLEKVHAMLSLWSKQPVPLIFVLERCDCPECVPPVMSETAKTLVSLALLGGAGKGM